MNDWKICELNLMVAKYGKWHLNCFMLNVSCHMLKRFYFVTMRYTWQTTIQVIIKLIIFILIESAFSLILCVKLFEACEKGIKWGPLWSWLDPPMKFLRIREVRYSKSNTYAWEMIPSIEKSWSHVLCKIIVI